jgi:hypothetical protein
MFRQPLEGSVKHNCKINKSLTGAYLRRGFLEVMVAAQCDTL